MVKLEVKAEIDPRDIQDAFRSYQKAFRRSPRKKPEDIISSVFYAAVFTYADAMLEAGFTSEAVHDSIRQFAQQAVFAAGLGGMK